MADENWNDVYEAEREEHAVWVGLQAVVGWPRLMTLAKMRCRSLREGRGILLEASDVAKYNFELGMLAGIEWLMQLPAAEGEMANERAAHALEMLRGERDEEMA